MKLKYKILIAALIVIAVASLAGYLYIFRTGHPDMLRQKTDYIIEAGDLYHEFETDEPEATAKYAGKILEVRGRLESVEKVGWGNIALIFLDPLFGVTCTIDSLQAVRQSVVLDPLSPGDQVAVKGRCDGMLTDVKVVHCVVMSDW